MSEALIQALIRLAVVFVTAGLSAIILVLQPIVDLIPDVTTRGLVLIVLTALINAALKWLGGPTEKPSTITGVAARVRGDVERPNILAV